MSKPKRSLENRGIIDGGVPFEITVTAKDKRPAWKRMYQNPNLGDTSKYYKGNVLEDVVSFVPGLGDAVDGVKVVDAVNRGNYLEAGVLGGSLLLPNAIEKPVKAVGKLVGKLVGKGIKKITKENAAKILPSEWTAAQDDAIAKGDMAEAQRLRDLHFKVSAPDNKLTTKLYHGTDAKWYSYSPTYFASGSGDLGAWGKGLYLSGYKNVAERYGKNLMSLYAYAKNPLEVKPTLGTWYNTPTEKAAYLFNREKGATQEIKDILKGKDAVNKYREIVGDNWVSAHEPYEEVVISDGRKLKSADAVTYDDNGVRIPLGERDNFNLNDIRYAIAPVLAGGIGYGAYRNQKASGGSIHIAPSKRGTFTTAASKHGMGVQEFASRVLRNKDSYSPAMVKKANFARNASKWHH